MKLCAVVVTYFPEVGEAIKNIKRYIDDVDHLIIWENTPKEKSEEYRIVLPEYSDKISYLSTGNNEGIAYSLNRAVEYAVDKGYTHLLTMDQDSLWVDFLDFKRLSAINEGNFALACPNVNNRWEKRTVTDAKACITSGSIYDLNIFKKIGLFREDYFIDAVDTEYCYRIIKNNEKILVFGQTSLSQTFGVPIKKFGLATCNYSAFRTYFIIRNHFWLWREYPEVMEPQLKKWVVRTMIIKRIILLVIVEDSKIQKFSSLVRGVFDGLFKYPPKTNA